MLLCDAMLAYREYVESHAAPHRFLLAVQKILPGLPMQWIESLAVLLQPDVRVTAVLQLYRKAMDLSKMKWPPAVR